MIGAAILAATLMAAQPVESGTAADVPANHDLGAFLAAAPAGDPDGGGVVVFDVTPAEGKLCWVLLWTYNLGRLTGLEVRSDRGTVAALAPSPFGCRTIDPATAWSIVRTPAAHRAVLTTADRPAGAVEGNLRASD